MLPSSKMRGPRKGQNSRSETEASPSQPRNPREPYVPVHKRQQKEQTTNTPSPQTKQPIPASRVVNISYQDLLEKQNVASPSPTHSLTTKFPSSAPSSPCTSTTINGTTTALTALSATPTTSMTTPTQTPTSTPIKKYKEVTISCSQWMKSGVGNSKNADDNESPIRQENSDNQIKQIEQIQIKTINTEPKFENLESEQNAPKPENEPKEESGLENLKQKLEKEKDEQDYELEWDKSVDNAQLMFSKKNPSKSISANSCKTERPWFPKRIKFSFWKRS